MKWNIINVTPVSVPGCVRPGLVGADWQMVQNSGVAADQARPGRGEGSGPGKSGPYYNHDTSDGKGLYHSFPKR